MNKKKVVYIIIFIILIIIGVLSFNQYNKYHKKSNTKIPVLLYHDFVTAVPESDPDNFNYKNKTQSFEENIKKILEDGYTIISKNFIRRINIPCEMTGKEIIEEIESF